MRKPTPVQYPLRLDANPLPPVGGWGTQLGEYSYQDARITHEFGRARRRYNLRRAVRPMFVRYHLRLALRVALALPVAWLLVTLTIIALG